MCDASVQTLQSKDKREFTVLVHTISTETFKVMASDEEDAKSCALSGLYESEHCTYHYSYAEIDRNDDEGEDRQNTSTDENN